MRKVIEGKLYDTETAMMLGSSSRGNEKSLEHVKETLYRKKGGEYFIHGEGGSCTDYAVEVDDSYWLAGEDIRTMSEESARKWAEENMTAEEYIRAFGDVQE